MVTNRTCVRIILVVAVAIIPAWAGGSQPSMASPGVVLSGADGEADLPAGDARPSQDVEGTQADPPRTNDSRGGP